MKQDKEVIYSEASQRNNGTALGPHSPDRVFELQGRDLIEWEPGLQTDFKLTSYKVRKTRLVVDTDKPERYGVVWWVAHEILVTSPESSL